MPYTDFLKYLIFWLGTLVQLDRFGFCLLFGICQDVFGFSSSFFVFTLSTNTIKRIDRIKDKIASVGNSGTEGVEIDWAKEEGLTNKRQGLKKAIIRINAKLLLILPMRDILY